MAALYQAFCAIFDELTQPERVALVEHARQYVNLGEDREMFAQITEHFAELDAEYRKAAAWVIVQLRVRQQRAKR